MPEVIGLVGVSGDLNVMLDSLGASVQSVESSGLVGGIEDIDMTPPPDKRLRVVLTADGLDIEDLIIEEVAYNAGVRKEVDDEGTPATPSVFAHRKPATPTGRKNGAMRSCADPAPPTR